MIYVINYYQAGNSQKSYSYSSSIGVITFKDKIDFKQIKRIGKALLKRTINDNNPCVGNISVYFSILRIENDKITGEYIGNFKLLNIVDWKIR